MNRRSFIAGMAGLMAGIIIPDIFKPNYAEAAIDIYRGKSKESADAGANNRNVRNYPGNGNGVYGSSNQTRPSHPWEKKNPSDIIRPDGGYSRKTEDEFQNIGFNVPIQETYLHFGALENRPMTDCIVIHHTGSSDDEDISAEAIHQWHLAKGWNGIGYHFVIRKDGTIQRGRPVNTVGAHCYGENNHTVGINIAGNFNIGYPTRFQLASAAALCLDLCAMYRLRPGRSVITGHRDWNSTQCPGDGMYDRLADLRQAVFNQIGG